ncbi:hypothetical protein LTR84_010370 [Exophiala bonariae]|uniref:Uncharacterized protein n=1 Tax=Exophiala bonariae TaxID=1690606 RepID=A0AAV9MTB0_9EURO|nr:hypothetical protein LTR84_010370 [Exophiala bonariae]
MSSRQELFRAAEAGRTAELKTILARGQVDVNSRDGSENGEGRAALHWAVSSGKRPAVEVLLQSGASVKSRDHSGKTPLILAAQTNGATEVVEALLSVTDIEVDASNHVGVTALMEAAKRGYLDTAKLLLKSKKIDINNRDNEGNTALLWAASRVHPQMIWLLLQYGAFRGFKNKYGQTAQDFGLPEIAGKGVFNEMPECPEDPTLSETVERDSAAPQDSLKSNMMHVLTGLQWRRVLGPRIPILETEIIKATGFSFLPKDHLSKGQMEEDVTSALRLAKEMTENDFDEEQCMWIHVPSNNVRASELQKSLSYG